MPVKPPGVAQGAGICGLLAAVCLFAIYALPNTSDHVLTMEQNEPVEHSLSRKVRQAYPVFGAGESGISVDTMDEEGQGPWTNWETTHECSRTCGGGVQIETRTCAGTGCTGPRKRYVSCNINPCPTEEDFRAAQCSKFDETSLEGKFYKWKPYTRAPNKCELNCMPEGENFYYKWAETVMDGTRCDAFNYDICVEGYCVPVGCDNKLGSALKEDRCRVCGGDGSTCKTIEGFFDEDNMKPGYHDVIVIPAGATSILVQERKPTNNYLALRRENGTYWLNGNWKIDFPQTFEAAGTLFDYERTKQNTVSFEKLYAKGPTKEPIVVVLLRQTENSGIQYEFSVPLTDSLPYQYSVSHWSDCSVTCGQGIQTREAECIDRFTKQTVDGELCANSTMPSLNRTCATVSDCEPDWFIGEWEPCSESCGESGMQYRVVYCHRALGDGGKLTVVDSLCEGERPAFKQSCNRFACPEWQTGPWSSCSSPCGESYQYRAVTCRSAKEGEEGQFLPAKACHISAEPENRRACNLGMCEGLRWHVTDWTLCQQCNDTTETRNVSCRDETNRQYPDDRCTEEKPLSERPCAMPTQCEYKWHSSQWSNCSTDCGHGHQTRSVFCAIEAGNKLLKMDEFHCNPVLKPEDRQNCTSEVECKGTYFSSDWDECSAKCGGGKQKRTVLCFDYDYRLNPAMCDEMVKPLDVQDCNMDSCPILCNETEFGCCPDRETPATGLYMEGCSNCSLSEFGCCPDNVTEALGSYLEGCSNCSLTEFGCCMDNISIALGPDFSGCDLDMSSGGDAENATDIADQLAVNCTADDVDCCPEEEGMILVDSRCVRKMCNYTSDQGMVLQMPCVNITSNLTTDNETIIDDSLLLNVTSDNDTEIHCSKTEFGCCPDWVTAAEGPDNLGCTVYELGDCAEDANATMYGCCPDNLTLARGPKFEGCGDAFCAASLYGCCADRHTIAFGPHYKGCERTTFDCENSDHGCCPDGKTAALSFDGKGCEENCVLSRYGCCPDGATVAEGPNNQGCGCSISQYGCCPDGKSTAEGPAFRGCPEGCATTHYGCCPDGETAARGPDFFGCPCRFTKYGCCLDGETAATGPDRQGCDDCRTSKHGCCPDGRKTAEGPNFEGCFEAPTDTVLGEVSREQTDACSLPADNGECSQYNLKWHYDSSEGTCRQFWYGGCGGNTNRFSSEAECKHVCINPPGRAACYLPRISGSTSCGPTTIRWYYDSAEGYCLQFYYNCNGNANNFLEREDCQELCEGLPKRPRPSTPRPEVTTVPGIITIESGTEEDICKMPMDSGPCKGRIDQYYFEPATGQCQMFTWGGCKGNANRFASKLQCEAKCSRTTEDICKLPKDPGPCDQYKPQWFYKHEDGTCSRFYYGGCHGNANRFETMEECQTQCADRVDPCSLPSVTGPCAGREMMYFFNYNTGTCEQFPYGGCLGNSNRFRTIEECQQRCQRTTPAPPGGVFSVSREEGVRVPPARDICSLPRETGPCRAYVPSFYFDSALRTCAPFVYGGCQGNANRFTTKQQCEATCAATVRHQNLVQDDNELTERDPYDLDSPASNELDPYRSHREYCNDAPSVGECRARMPRWYYDPKRGECFEFVYGGCGGNRNNFDSRDDCLRVCTDDGSSSSNNGDGGEPVGNVGLVQYERQDEQVHTAAEPQMKASSIPPRLYPLPTSLLPDLCRQTKDPGNCYGNMLSWYYDSERMRCTTFMYTGCGGNSNRFTSEEACERACGVYRDQDVCSLPADEGPCLASVPKWFYDSSTRQCSSFVYGGCEGNGNRFSSKEECRNLCQRPTTTDQTDICAMERDPGPCLEPMSQYYFDQASGECKLFTYGGCRGNGNRFNTKEECESRCARKPAAAQEMETRSKAVCTLIFDAGPCHNSQQKWYYDSKTSRCRQFVYGGCGGNDNRFDSERDCVSLCAPADHSRESYTIEGQQITLRIDSARFTYPQGQNILLDCTGGPEALHHGHNVVWYKDGQPMPREADSRIEVQFNGSLVISRSTTSDSGDYNCALLQPSGSFSRAVRITVDESRATAAPRSNAAPPDDCVDNPRLANCRLVVSAGLCDHNYYGKYCCASCWSQGVKAKRSLRRLHSAPPVKRD